MTLPLNADPIYVEWPIKEGGVRAYAWTDAYGRAYIAIKTLNRIGQTSGLADWHRSHSFSSEIVVGFIDERPLVVCVQARATHRGLLLIVRPPKDAQSTHNYREARFAAWGSEAPYFSVMVSPALSSMASCSYQNALSRNNITKEILHV